MNKNFIFSMFFIFCCLTLLIIPNSRAEDFEDKKLDGKISDSADIDKCVATFDLNKFNTGYYEEESLLEYRTCLSAVYDDVQECRKTPTIETYNKCKTLYENQKLYSLLFSSGSVTASAQQLCEYTFVQPTGGGTFKDSVENVCKATLNGMLSNNPSQCNNIVDKGYRDLCLSWSQQNENLCSNQNCRDMINFIRAFKNRDVNKCLAIKNSRYKWSCIGAVSKDRKKCEACDGVKKAKISICTKQVSMNKVANLGQPQENNNEKK